MSASIQIDSKIGEIGKKSKRIVDLVYFAALFVFVASVACKFVSSTPFYIEPYYMVSTAVLSLIAIYRIFFEYFKERKKALLIVGYVLLSIVIFYFTGNNVALNAAVIAVAGVGIKADHILTVGILGNLVMIANNIYMSLVTPPTVFTVFNQDRHFLLLGDNTFYVSKMNNYSSTDFASHYFWIIGPYLWIRGKKITWGEILALTGLNLLVYSFTASKTSLFCISLLLFLALVMKIYDLIGKKGYISKISPKIKSLCKRLLSVLEYCFKYSFVIFAFVGILLALIYTNSNPLFVKLNNLLHWRLSLGHRGIIEYGIHLFASNVPTYGMSSSADGFYNFIDCSYMKILLCNGVIMLIFYLLSMTLIQTKHKKYIYGAAILAVYALSCFEEHHLSEVPYNFFILILFSDFNLDSKKEAAVYKKNSIKSLIDPVSFALCISFIIGTVLNYYPKYKAVKELDRLDSKADEIYSAVQRSIDSKIADNSWYLITSEMNSDQYGNLLSAPSDFNSVIGTSWSWMNKDPKEHAYYAVPYNVSVSKNDDYPILDLIISDEVNGLIGSGSAIIEYDVITGKVYAVWYSESSYCYEIPYGRQSDRAGRLRDDSLAVEGYSTGN